MSASDAAANAALVYPTVLSVSSLSVRLNILLHGMTPLYFHIVNVCLHCAVTCLLMHTCERCVFEDTRLAFVTALLFAVHPVHTEAVSTHDPYSQVTQRIGQGGREFNPHVQHSTLCYNQKQSKCVLRYGLHILLLSNP